MTHVLLTSKCNNWLGEFGTNHGECTVIYDNSVVYSFAIAILYYEGLLLKKNQTHGRLGYGLCLDYMQNTNFRIASFSERLGCVQSRATIGKSWCGILLPHDWIGSHNTTQCGYTKS